MIDTLLAALPRLDTAAAHRRFGLPERYAVATVHRPANVDAPDDARRLVGALADLAAQVPTVLPLHPRGRASLEAAGLQAIDRLQVVEPLGYLEFMALVQGAALVLTDSGGLQEETTVLGVPCLTIRPNTERPITITHGTNRLVAPGEVAAAVRAILDGPPARPPEPPPLWDGRAGERIARVLSVWLDGPDGRRRRRHRAAAGSTTCRAGSPSGSSTRRRHDPQGYRSRTWSWPCPRQLPPVLRSDRGDQVGHRRRVWRIQRRS